MPILLGAALLSFNDADASPITLLTSGNGVNNEVQATVQPSGFSQAQTTNPVNSLPFTTVTTASVGSDSGPYTASVTPAFSTSSLSAGFGGSLFDSSSTAHGFTNISFTAGQGTNYSIFGSATISGSIGYDLNLQLADLTTGKTIYFDDVQSSGPATGASLDSTGGSLTGLLTSGDQYNLQMNQSLFPTQSSFFVPDIPSAPYTLTGSEGVNFTQASTPEPVAGSVLLVGGAILLCRRRRTGSRSRP